MISWYQVPWVAVTGNQPSRTPKISWATLPMTKIGMEIRNSVLTVTRLSMNLPAPDAGQHPGGDADDRSR